MSAVNVIKVNSVISEVQLQDGFEPFQPGFMAQVRTAGLVSHRSPVYLFAVGNWAAPQRSRSFPPHTGIQLKLCGTPELMTAERTMQTKKSKQVQDSCTAVFSNANTLYKNPTLRFLFYLFHSSESYSFVPVGAEGTAWFCGTSAIPTQIRCSENVA